MGNGVCGLMGALVYVKPTQPKMAQELISLLGLPPYNVKGLVIEGRQKGEWTLSSEKGEVAVSPDLLVLEEEMPSFQVTEEDSRLLVAAGKPCSEVRTGTYLVLFTRESTMGLSDEIPGRVSVVLTPLGHLLELPETVVSQVA